jgi:hypothetical protein
VLEAVNGCDVGVVKRGQQSSRRIWIHFASSYPEQELFSILIQRLCPTYQNNKAKVTPLTFLKLASP